MAEAAQCQCSSPASPLGFYWASDFDWRSKEAEPEVASLIRHRCGNAAELMGVAPPPEVPFEAAEMTPLARSFYADNKRISNAAIKAALGIDLLYPNYREGLSAIAN